MSERDSRPGSRGPRRFQRNGPKSQKGGQYRDEGRREQSSDDRKDDRKDERKGTFVPWLGEARPKRGPIYDLEDKVGTKITIEFLSGRVIEGKLASYDRYMNLVLDETVELLDEGKTRALGKVFTCGRVESMGPTPA